MSNAQNGWIIDKLKVQRLKKTVGGPFCLWEQGC